MSLSEQDKAWGMRALTVAMKAKSRCLTVRDRLEFSKHTISLMAERPEIGAVLIDFEYRVDVDPAASGARLHDFLNGWQRDIDQGADTLIGSLQQEFEYDWQERHFD